MNDDMRAIESRWALARAIQAWARVDPKARTRVIGELDDMRLAALGGTDDPSGLGEASDLLEAIASDPRTSLVDQLVDDISVLLKTREP